jgi:hypothetical protein
MSAIAIETVSLEAGLPSAVKPSVAKRGSLKRGTGKKVNGQLESGQYVQHMFDWDAPGVSSPGAIDPSMETIALATNTSCEALAPKNLRRGRCEHVGGVMGAVLSKYGLGIDDLLQAIQERQLQLGVSR